MRSAWSALVLSVALLAGCGSAMLNPVTGETERSVMSEEDELAEGAKAHAEVLQEYGVVANPALQAYVTALGNKLAAQSHRSQLQWHFTVLDSPEINAFALPGGYVYVTRGILAYLDSEADLAGVMGHEIGHVTARHGAQRATRQQDAGLGVLAASVLGAVLESQGFGGAGRLAGDLSQTVAAGYIASYGREQELQADALGAEYLSRVHYDPRNMVDVIRVLKAQEQYAADVARSEGRPLPKGNDWLASHPSNDQRLEAISRLAAQYQGSKYEDEGRARYQRAIAGITFGDSAAQGLVRGRDFYHPTLGFALSAPPEWQFHNDATQLAVVNRAGDAAMVLRVVPASAGNCQPCGTRVTVNGVGGKGACMRPVYQSASVVQRAPSAWLRSTASAKARPATPSATVGSQRAASGTGWPVCSARICRAASRYSWANASRYPSGWPAGTRVAWRAAALSTRPGRSSWRLPPCGVNHSSFGCS